jgi:hypothetical protein
MKRMIAQGALVLLAATPAPAAELGGIEMPGTITLEGRQLVLNGMGLREKLWVDVYVAGLYLERRSTDAEEILSSGQAKHLRMHFLYKKVGAKKLTDAWSEGFEANAGEAAARLRPDLERLNSWMEDIAAGDEMTFTAVPDKGLEVTVKGARRGVIEGDEFASAFWKIFLGRRPPTEKLKTGLLGAE